MRKIRYAVKAIINAGAYESIHCELEETLDVPEDKPATIIRRKLIDVVTATVETEVVRHKADIRKAKRKNKE
jgi:hypothetical protein